LIDISNEEMDLIRKLEHTHTLHIPVNPSLIKNRWKVQFIFFFFRASVILDGLGFSPKMQGQPTRFVLVNCIRED
jgi:hypothetical protein